MQQESFINKFVIVSMGRTGSTLLASLLNNHPGLFCDEELFHERYFPEKAADNHEHIAHYRKKNGSKPVYGFRFKVYQTELPGVSEMTPGLLSQLHLQGYKIIYLDRTNIIRHAFSMIRAAETQVFHLQAGQVRKKHKISVSMRSMLNTLSFIKSIRLKETRALRNIPHLKINYEQELQHEQMHQKTADKIFDYLGLPPAKVATDFLKTSADKPEDDIENYFLLKLLLKLKGY